MLPNRPRRRPRLHAVLVLTAVAVLASCSGGDDAGGGATPSTPTDTTDLPNSDTTPAPDDVSATTDAAEQDGVDAVASESGASPFPWLPEISVLTQPSEDLRPLLEWEAVDGAVEYSVTVSAPDGRPYWAWRTQETSVHLGGNPRLDDDQSGPSTVPGMTMSVIAFDGERQPIAASTEHLLRS